MADIRLENHFPVPASVPDAWDLLNDVPAVVPCMPGAELKEILGENQWKGVLHVKLGPIALQVAAHIVRDAAGAGGAARRLGSSRAWRRAKAGPRSASPPTSRSRAPSRSTGAGSSLTCPRS